MNENTEIDKNKEKPAQTHKIGIYLWIWGLLFVLSFFSYMVDWYQFQGILRWSLILFFMFLAACLILCSFSTRPILTKFSPYSPNPIAGATEMSASLSRTLENSHEPKDLNFSGIGAQANIVASGEGMFQPALPIASTKTSLRFLYTCLTFSIVAGSELRALAAATWIGVNAP